MNHRIIQNRPPRPFAAVLIALVAFAVLTSPILTAYAAAPVNAISYQGRLLDSSGNPVSDANVNMQFSFHTLVAGGACLWSNDDSACGSTADMVVPLTDGLFSVNLGDKDAVKLSGRFLCTISSLAINSTSSGVKLTVSFLFPDCSLVKTKSAKTFFSSAKPLLSNHVLSFIRF